MLLAVKEDVAFDPMDVRLLGAIAIVALAQCIADPIQESRTAVGWRRILILHDYLSPYVFNKAYMYIYTLYNILIFMQVDLSVAKRVDVHLPFRVHISR